MNYQALRAYLKRGGIIAYPAESCYGLGCDPFDRNAVQRLILLKGRPVSKGLILIADRFSRFDRLVKPLDANAQSRVSSTWPGPVTWVLPARRGAPWLRGGKPGLAVRVTAHRPAARLCRGLGMALVSTSANKSGGRPVKTARECRRIFGDRIRVIDGPAGRRKRPSTLIDLPTGNVLRP